MATSSVLGRCTFQCNGCARTVVKALVCTQCAAASCPPCASMTDKQLPLSLLRVCATCRAGRLPLLDSLENEDAFGRRFALLCLADASIALAAPSDNQRYAIRAYCRWAETVALQALPADLDVILLFLQHRLHVDKVDTSTLELDVNALSAWHVSAAQAMRYPSLQNPAKLAAVRYETRIFGKTLKKLARPMMKWLMQELVLMVRSCPDTAFGWHDRVCMTALSLAILRKGAAAALRLVRTDATDPLSFDLEKSDIIIATHPTYGRYVRLSIHTDKNAVPGRPRYAYIPAHTRLGLNFVQDISHYLTRFPVPDGFLFAAPRGKHGKTFRTTAYTSWDPLVHRCYGRAFPGGKKVVASHSCRKSIIQALYNTGLAEGVIGDIVGWLSVKSTVLKYYASLSVEHALVIVACICDLVSVVDTTSTVSPP